MKKYISIHDIEASFAHVFKLPEHLMAHVKICHDGVAVAFFSVDNDEVYGIMLNCPKHFRSLLKEIVESKSEHHLQEYLLGQVMVDINTFVSNDEPIFIVECYSCDWEEKFVQGLQEIENQREIAKHFREEIRAAANKNEQSKKNKKSNQK